MTVQVLMPQFGESVVEGYITRWFKSPGDAVEEFEALIEVNTDKVDTEVPCPATGILVEILIPEGKVAQAGEVLGVIETDLTPRVRSGHDQTLGFISPVVAKIAKEEKIDLRQVNGTGLGGRITRQDVQAYLATHPSGSQPEAGWTANSTGLIEDELIPHTPMRKRIAEHMVLSKQTSPHATTVREADLSRIVAHRQANKDAYALEGVNLTFTAYFIAAAAAALNAHPIVNSSWSDAGVILHKNIHIGMATSLNEEGLIVPVIKNADSLSLLELARVINDLAARARLHQLKPHEVKDGTFTLTNHGIGGSLFATPIINQPQCGILGIGAIQKRVVVITGEDGSDLIAIRPMVYLSFTFDHRILDGAKADYFLAKVVKSLQTIN